jgi:hypothetical protein
MKTSSRYHVKTGKIRSLEDIAAEKARLKFEIRLKEEHIRTNYHHIMEAFTFRSLATNLVTEISSSGPSVLSKAISIGKSFLEKRKKKKKEKLSGAPSNTLTGH